MRFRYGIKAMALAAVLSFLFLLNGCSNAESKSKELYELAQFEEQQNNVRHARELYEQIVRDYPGAPSSERARERLKALEARQGSGGA